MSTERLHNQISRIPQPSNGPVQRSLRALREAAGLSQAQAAEAMGVSQQAVGKWEQADDPGDAWPRLAKLYGVRLQYPSEPFNLAKQQEWLKSRNAQIRRYKPRVASIGAGKAPQAA